MMPTTRCASFLLLPLMVLLLAPAPGEVGGCGGEEVIADAVQYCFDRAGLTCAREAQRGDIALDAEAQCQVDRQAPCPTLQWDVNCQPSQRAVDSCLAALADPRRLSTATDDIGECLPEVLCRN